MTHPTKMRWYKIVACILMLSIFNFVLAAPVEVQEVRQACADPVAADDADNMMIGSWKRADKEGTQQEPSSSLSQDEAKLVQPESSTEILPASSSNDAKPVQPPYIKTAQMPSGLIYSEIIQPGQKGYPSQLGPWPRPKPQSMFSKMVEGAKNLFSKIKFWRRISGTASDVVAEH